MSQNPDVLLIKECPDSVCTLDLEVVLAKVSRANQVVLSDDLMIDHDQKRIPNKIFGPEEEKNIQKLPF